MIEKTPASYAYYPIERPAHRPLKNMTPAELAGCGLDEDVQAYIIELRHERDLWKRLFNQTLEAPE